jgi:imidazolonepropionase-like amidohydrolase
LAAKPFTALKRRSSEMFASLILSSFSLAIAVAPLAQTEPAESVHSLVVDALHIGNGEVLENAVVVIADGKIQSVVAGGKAPDGATHIEGAHLTPGLVDAFSYMSVNSTSVEQSRETTAGMPLARSVRLDDAAFRTAAAEGVTTAFLTPDSLNAFGGLAMVVKTAGGLPADLYAPAGSAAQVIVEQAALKISLGNDVAMGNHSPRGVPRDFQTRRPTTRMGTVWTLRREFHRARNYRAKLKAGEIEFDADLDAIARVVAGELPLRVQARRNNDVQTVLRLAQEFDLKNVVIEEGTEAYRAAELLAAAGIRVVTGPAYDVLSRSIARGPSLAELRFAANPPQICCEHLHEDSFLSNWESGGSVYPMANPSADALGCEVHEIERNQFGMAIDPNDPLMAEEVRHEPGVEPLSGLAQDLNLLMSAPRYAQGLRSGRNSEGDQATPALAALLAQAGIYTALGGAEAHDAPATEASLIHQARSAVRAGLNPHHAIAMITSHAAALSGVGDQLGLVKVGFDADLVLWSGDPLANSSRPLLVLVDGQVVLDNRN